MAANKVVFGEEVIMDLTGDSVSPENLLAGETAHDRAGNPVTGAVITHDVVDNLESTSTEDALSANQGRELKEMMSDVPHREDNEDTVIEVPNIDADMLNGHPADYYSKQSDLSALNTSVTQVNNKIGNTDVSKWGNSLTGAIKAACDKSDANEVAIAEVNSNLYNAKNPVMLYDISTNSYNANDFLGGNIDMSAYSGFLICYSDRVGGYQKSSYFPGKMSGMYQALDFTNENDKHYFAGVQVRGNGLFVEIVGANKPFIVRLYGIPA